MSDQASSASFDPECSVVSSDSSAQDEQHPIEFSIRPMGNRTSSMRHQAEQDVLQGEVEGDELFANNNNANNDNAERLSTVSTEISEEIVAHNDSFHERRLQLHLQAKEATIAQLRNTLRERERMWTTEKERVEKLEKDYKNLQEQLNAQNDQSVLSATENISFLKKHFKTVIVVALIILVSFSLLVYNTSRPAAAATTGTCPSAEQAFFDNLKVENVRASRSDIMCVFGIMPCVCMDSFCVQATVTLWSYLSSIEPWATFVGVSDLTFTKTTDTDPTEMQQLFAKIQCPDDIEVNGMHWHCKKTVPASVLFH